MKLLVILLCLSSERFLIHSLSYNRLNLFQHYFSLIEQLLSRFKLPNHAVLKLLLLILPLVLLTSILYMALNTVLFGFFLFLVDALILYICLGPQNPFYPIISSDSDDVSTGSVNYLAEVNSQLFAVLFWYLLGGPIAVLAYRLLSLAQSSAHVSVLAKNCTSLLEWLPARMTVLLYLLVGNFQAGFKQFKNYFWANPNLNNELLKECGLLALVRSDADEISLPIAETLVEHSVVVLLVLIALFTLAVSV